MQNANLSEESKIKIISKIINEDNKTEVDRLISSKIRYDKLTNQTILDIIRANYNQSFKKTKDDKRGLELSFVIK